MTGGGYTSIAGWLGIVRGDWREVGDATAWWLRLLSQTERNLLLGNVLSPRYRYGASFIDEASGVRFEGHHPFERPDLWNRYLEDAEGKYRSFGFEGTLRRRELDEGQGVPLFFVGFAPNGDPVAGLRFHGPLENRWDAALIEEMADLPELDEIGSLIDSEAKFGIIEAKGGWAKGEAVLGVRMVATISRIMTHAAVWLGAERTIAAVSDLLIPVGKVAGGEVLSRNHVPFPDERYRTYAVTWQRSRSYDLADETNQRALRLEAEQLARGPRASCARPVDVASVRTHSFQPLVLDVATRSDREVLRILREDPSLQVIDQLDDQRSALAELKPAASLNQLNESPRWIYYPWRRAVVRLLGPRSFARVRLDRNRNKLTHEEQSRLRGLRVGVVGASAGHSIAHVIAMEGLAGEIRLADFDSIDLTNLNRIPASVLDLGVNKAIVAARRIAEIDPFVRVSVLSEGVTADNLDRFLDGLDVVIEECDSLDMKFLVREQARARRIPVFMETSDRGVLDVERFDLEPGRAVFHGLLGDVTAEKVAGLTLLEKGPYLLRILGADEVSSRGAVTFFEIGTTITGWPQLASEVTLGAATVAAAVRRLGLGGDLPSGRVRFDVEEILGGLAPVDLSVDADIDLSAPPPLDPVPEDGDDVTMIVDAARRAPSGGNSQPWRFEADDDEIRFFLVPERTSVMDVQHRGSYVALGAALFNARVAAASRHRLGTIKLFPDGAPSHHVATLRLGETTDQQITPLNPLIPKRVSNRQPGQPAPIDGNVEDLLARVVAAEGANLRLISDRLRLNEGGELLGQCDRLRFLIPQVHQQMLGELKFPGRDPLDEGLDVRTLEMDPTSIAAVGLLRRPDVMAHLVDWRAGQMLGLRTQLLVGTSSALAAITIPRADPLWYVRAGAAIERFWLSAQLHGLAVQPVAPIFLYATDDGDLLSLGGERHLDHMHSLRGRFATLWDLDDGEAVTMVLRVSHAVPASTQSIRRPLSEVLAREVDSGEVPVEIGT